MRTDEELQEFVAYLCDESSRRWPLAYRVLGYFPQSLTAAQLKAEMKRVQEALRAAGERIYSAQYLLALRKMAINWPLESRIAGWSFDQHFSAVSPEMLERIREHDSEAVSCKALDAAVRNIKRADGMRADGFTKEAIDIVERQTPLHPTTHMLGELSRRYQKHLRKMTAVLARLTAADHRASEALLSDTVEAIDLFRKQMTETPAAVQVIE